MRQSTKEELAKLNIMVKDLSPKPGEGANLSITMQPTPNRLTGFYGIENIKEVATPICGLINTAVNKKGLVGIIGIIPDIYPAYDDFEFVDEEFLDMDEEEFVSLTNHIKSKLVFEGTAQQYEEVAEDVAVVVLRMILVAIKIIRIKKGVV